MRRVDGYPPPAFCRQAIPGVSVLGQLAAIIAPVFACAAIGYLWARLRRPFETEFVTALVTNVGTPCLVASTLTKLSVDVGSFGSMALGALAVFATVRSEERRVGKECVSTCRSRWSPDNKK